MQQRVGTAHRLLCPKECLPKRLRRKRPDLHRSPFGFFAPFPVLFGHRVAPQLTVVTSTIARSGVAMHVKDAHAASVVPREAAAPAMTVVGKIKQLGLYNRAAYFV
jgi:hypothetical protein